MEGISFIIPSRRGSEALRLCLESIKRGSALDNQIIVIADSPSWQTIRLLQDDFDMVLDKDYFITNYEHIDRNMDYGVQFVERDYICITCDDMVFSKGWDNAVMEVMDGKNNRIVTTVYYTGPTGSWIAMDIDEVKESYQASNRESKATFDWDLFNSLAPAPHDHIEKSGSPPFLVFHKDVYKLANGLDYFATQGQAFEGAFGARAQTLGCDHVITNKAVAAHLGQFANADNQKATLFLPCSHGVFECSVCHHIELSEGNNEFPQMSLTQPPNRRMEVKGGSERGRLTLKTGLFLCERCRKDGWIINIGRCKLEKR